MGERHGREAWERGMGERHGTEAWERGMGERHGRVIIESFSPQCACGRVRIQKCFLSNTLELARHFYA